jgi:hypothetical protein
MGATIRITAFIEEERARKFTALTSQIGVSGTALLNRALPAELNYLAEVPANSESGAALGRFIDEFDDDKYRRLNITLDRTHAERMDQLCREKRVSRDSFLGAFLAFLVYGEQGVCEAPLKKISEMLVNPRHEYEEKRRSGPEAVPQDNPYRFLHHDEEEVNGMLQFAPKFRRAWREEEEAKKDRTPENK